MNLSNAEYIGSRLPTSCAPSEDDLYLGKPQAKVS